MTYSTSAIVIMGISGCGKSTLGHLLSEATGYRFVEGDDLHRPENIAKMSAGIALTDEDRWPWLERVASVLKEAQEVKGPDRLGRIVSCSALRRSYRDLLRLRFGAGLLFVFPKVSGETVQSRLRKRQDHYMPLSLLKSQLATLEEPDPDEPVLTIDGERNPAQSVDLILGYLTMSDENRTRIKPLSGARNPT